MTVATRATLKGYFDNGDTITASAMVDLIDSFVHLSDTTAQSLNSDLTVPNLVATNISANNVGAAGKITASAATFTGLVKQGASAAASATQSLGYFLVTQEGTVAGAATAQVAFLPQSNIIGLRAKVLVGGSTGTGGLEINAGISGNKTYFGTLSVSANGLYDFVNVSGVRLKDSGVIGSIQFVCSGASAGTNVIGVVLYHQVP